MICLFSDLVLGTNTLISPSSKYLAIVSNSRLTVRDSETLGIIHIFPGVDTIDKVMFSPDSQYIMMCTFRRNTVQIFSLLDGDWRCRINEGVASIVNAQWTPDSRGVITESDFGIQLSVWSLIDSTSHYMLKPKESFYSNSTTGGSTVTALSNPLRSIQLVSSPDVFIQQYSTLLSGKRCHHSHHYSLVGIVTMMMIVLTPPSLYALSIHTLTTLYLLPSFTIHHTLHLHHCSLPSYQLMIPRNAILPSCIESILKTI